MIRIAGPNDAAAMERFLAQHPETSMFLRGNLAAFGTEEKTHRNGTEFFLCAPDDQICAVAGVTNSGYVMCQSDTVPERFFLEFAAAMKGRIIAGMTGAEDDVRAVFDAFGCQNVAFSVRRHEPLYALDLTDLDALAHRDGTLRTPCETDAEWLADWFVAYETETGLLPQGASDGRNAALRFMQSSDAALLIRDGQPVAMSNFNARAQDCVQIGGVYVPSKFRGRGYGGEVVAKSLLAARDEGVYKAILFAASDSAARAYERIGFSHIGSYEIALFETPWQVPT